MNHEQRYREAAEWRQRFAEECGFKDFAAVMKYGIVRAGKLHAAREKAGLIGGGTPRAPAPEIT